MTREIINFQDRHVRDNSRSFLMDNMELLKQTPDKFYELAIVDPQYAINAPNMRMGHNPNRKDMSGGATTAVRLKKKGRLNSGGGKLKNRILNRSEIDWDNEPPTEEYWKELMRVSKNQIIWGGNYFPLPPTRGIVCWDKVQPWENFSQWEMAWTSFDTTAKLYRISNTGGGNKVKKIHPTEKPVSLYKKLLKDFAKEGDKILDTHLGSGNSRQAAFEMGFDFTGCEISPSYWKDSNEAFEAFLLQPRLVKYNHNPIQEQLL